MNTLTKFAVALPTLALLSACATTAPTTPAPYTCTDGSKILAKQSINKKQVMLDATLPKVNWANQPIILNGGVQGDTASYVNESNSEVVYAWHMKEDRGIFAMKWADGKEYQVNCQI